MGVMREAASTDHKRRVAPLVALLLALLVVEGYVQTTGRLGGEGRQPNSALPNPPVPTGLVQGSPVPSFTGEGLPELFTVTTTPSTPIDQSAYTTAPSACLVRAGLDKDRVCGTAATNRATTIPKDVNDPMLQCGPEIAAHLAFAAHGFRSKPLLDGTSQIMEAGSTTPMFHSIWRDFGCFTYYRGPDHVVFGSLVGDSAQQHDRAAVALVVETTSILDVGSAHFTHDYYSGDIVPWGNEEVFHTRTRLKALLAPGLVAKLRALGELDRPAPSKEWERDLRTAVPPGAPVEVIGGDVAFASSQYSSLHLIGQVFQEFFSYASRLYAAGLLDRPSLTLVLQQLEHADDEPFREWLYPYLGSKVRIVRLDPGRAVVAQHPYFTPPWGYEAVEPCQQLFVSFHLLPQVLARLRSDVATFTYGDEDVRRDTGNSNMDWFATFPRKVAILKDNRNARHTRGFAMDDHARRVLRAKGYVIVSDVAPFEQRLALINAADVLLTTFGALLAMMSRLYGGLHLRPTRPLRIVVLVHEGYKDEMEWASLRLSRVGVQHGWKVWVTNSSTLTPVYGAWAKYVMPPGAVPLAEVASSSAVDFKESDCTLDPTVATDFGSRLQVPATKLDTRLTLDAIRKSWPHIPVIGDQCPVP